MEEKSFMSVSFRVRQAAERVELAGQAAPRPSLPVDYRLDLQRGPGARW